MSEPTYSYCESIHATGYSKWHIRQLSAIGQKFGGGIDTPSLCGRATPAIGGWDLRAKFGTVRREHICQMCMEKMEAGE